VASSAFHLAEPGLRERVHPGRYNAYCFHAPAGENASEERTTAEQPVARRAERANHAGYGATGGIATFRPRDTQLSELFAVARAQGKPVGLSRLGSQEDVWRAIREFFREEQARVD